MDDSIALRVFEPDTATAADWRAFHAFRRECAAEDYPGRQIAPDEAAERDLRTADPMWHSRSLVAVARDQVVGRLQLWWRREGSPDHGQYAGYLMAGGGVRRDWRRRGVATALARELLAFMQDQGSHIVSFRVPNPDSGAGFLARIGARETYRDIDNRLPLADAPWPDIEHWAQAPEGMRWEVHAGRVPMDRLRALAPAIDAMLADVPRGQGDHPPIAFEADGYDAVYVRMDARQGLHFFVVLHAGGQVAAVSEATWFDDAPEAANQLFTGVAGDFRGRGLGVAVKSRMLQLVRDKAPGALAVLTNNSVDNTAMLRINARLGFQAARQSAVFQLRRDALAQHLRATG